MKLRHFIFAATMHGASIALAFTILPEVGLQTSAAQLGQVAVEYSVSSQEPAELPAREVAPTEKPEPPMLETTPSFIADHAPEEPVKVEILPDPVEQWPMHDELLPSRPQPKLELPRVAKLTKTSTSERAATPVEKASDSGTSRDFTPPALLSWDAPESFKLHFRGRIVAIVEISVDGLAQSVALEKSTGDADVDRDVRSALLKAKYSPARDGDKKVPSTLRQPFNVK